MSTARASGSASAQSSTASRSLASRQGSSSPLASTSATQDHDSDNEGQGVQMILRIKRKRNQDPVDALIIQPRIERRNKRDQCPSRRTTTTRTRHLKAGQMKLTQLKPSSAGVFRLPRRSRFNPSRILSQHVSYTSVSRRVQRKSAGPSTKPLHPSKLSQSVSSPSLTQAALSKQHQAVPPRATTPVKMIQLQHHVLTILSAIQSRL